MRTAVPSTCMNVIDYTLDRSSPPISSTRSCAARVGGCSTIESSHDFAVLIFQMLISRGLSRSYNTPPSAKCKQESTITEVDTGVTGHIRTLPVLDHTHMKPSFMLQFPYLLSCLRGDSVLSVRLFRSSRGTRNPTKGALTMAKNSQRVHRHHDLQDCLPQALIRQTLHQQHFLAGGILT